MNFLRCLKFNLAYFGKAPWDSGITPPELYEFIAHYKASRAIDIGCGTGTNIITLANAGWQVTGFDFASRAVQIAKRKLKKTGIRAEVFVDDATRMKNVSGQFDLALDMGCFHGIENKQDYLTQLTRILAPNGFWLMYGFFKPDPSTGSGRRPHLPGPGLVEADIDLISARGLTLLSRKNGFDKKERPSAWFLYQNLK